ncbi:hypothetical protein QBC46DRAFT_406760 [Diplogelasinospora grovesii]|uniref:Uncharacterized protein n=1 Tax=Diplogelasinospora grovesii TaxID=303347 RepID=A0AAN6NC77_9PEZI|nr:hypothetical protein QBC46DRAFT_406760 [Diplogelasinospora grovesii]
MCDPKSWDLVEEKTYSKYLKSRVNTTTKYISPGPPPKELLAGGRRTCMFYRADGTLCDPRLIPKDSSFESTITRIDGEEKREFIEFVKRMLKWRREERSTARELMSDPWILNEYSQFEELNREYFPS